VWRGIIAPEAHAEAGVEHDATTAALLSDLDHRPPPTWPRLQLAISQA
jgi:hypothetical protein